MNGVFDRAVRILAVAVCFTPLWVNADLIDNFGLGEGPMLVTDDLLVAYDVENGLLSMRGFDVGVDFGEGLLSVDGSGIDLVLSVDGSGIASGGSFEILGELPDMGFDSGILLAGEISDFGWPTGDEERNAFDFLQFVLTVTSGDAAGVFGTRLAFLVTDTDFPGGWSFDWANNGRAMGVAAPPVPVPAALWLMGSALFGLALTRRPTKGVRVN